MAKGEFVSFMYHEFQTPGRVTSRSNPGYMRYVVSASMFAKQLSAMRSDGYTGCCVTEAFKGSDGAVAITIDDSNTTDLEVAAPILCEYGFRATFFAVASWINSHNHLTSKDLRTLVSMGMEIGSHSLTHCPISHMPLPEIRRELAESKDFLEQVSGVPVKNFSCPFGGYSAALFDTAMEVGYATVATSRIGHNRRGDTVLKRVAVHQNTKLSTFQRMYKGGGLFIPLVRQALLDPFKKANLLLGYSS